MKSEFMIGWEAGMRIVKVEPPAEQPARAADEVPSVLRSLSPEERAAYPVITDAQITSALEAGARDRWNAEHPTNPLPPAPAQGAPAEPLSARIRRIRWAWDRKDERRASVEKLADEVTVLEARLAAAEREREAYSDAIERVRCDREKYRRERDEARRLATADRDENARLKAELSVLTSERDEALVSVKQAVAAERERCVRVACAELLKFKLAHRRDQFDEADIAEAIRDGKPAPK